MQTTGWEFGKYLIAPVVSALLGYLIGAFTKISKSEHKQALETQEKHWSEKFASLEKQVEKQGERNSKFETALADKVSKGELKEAVTDLKLAITEMRAELREDFVALRAALNARP